MIFVRSFLLARAGRFRRLAASLPAIGLGLGLIAVAAASGTTGDAHQAPLDVASAQVGMSYRVFGPAIGCDSCASASAMPTQTRVTAATPTASPTRTATLPPTATATPTKTTAATATATKTPTPAPYSVVSYAFCRTSPTCASGPEQLQVGQMARVVFTLSRKPQTSLTADVFWNGVQYNHFVWAPPYTGVGFYLADPSLGFPQAAGTVELRIFADGVQVGTISASVTGSLPTATPTPTPTPTPQLYFPPGGGSTGCLARSVTWDWELCVRESYLDLFEIRVTALTEEATDSSFKIRVYAPDDFLGTDSFTKWPFYVGQTFRLDYGFDFFEYGPYPAGLYEIELRVDFLRETRVYINVY